MIVYLPILTLEGIEGKLFRPMALTVIFALAGSMVLSLTLMPVLASLLLPRKDRGAGAAPDAARACRSTSRSCGSAMRHKRLVVGFALLRADRSRSADRAEPRLGVRADAVRRGRSSSASSRLAGTELEESIRYNTQMEKAILAAFPDEVEHVWSRIGTAEVATDPMGVELTDMFITLKPRDAWTEGPKTQDELTELIEKDAARPARAAARVLAADRAAHQRDGLRRPQRRGQSSCSATTSTCSTKAASEIEEVLRDDRRRKPTSRSSRSRASRSCRSAIKQDEIARYGVPAKDGARPGRVGRQKPLGEVVEGQMRFPLVVRLPEKHRQASGGDRRRCWCRRRPASGSRCRGWPTSR